jgi:hypothetical protein
MDVSEFVTYQEFLVCVCVCARTRAHVHLSVGVYVCETSVMKHVASWMKAHTIGYI